MSRLVFIDTETTSLRHDRRAWEIGLIERTGDVDVEHHWFVRTEDLDLGNADPMSLRIGRFYERHSEMNGTDDPWDGQTSFELYVLRDVERLTRGAHLVGAVPNFDADVLGQRMRANGICPSWHYHLIDVEALMVGHLNTLARWIYSNSDGDNETVARAEELRALARPPWKSDDLARAVGVESREEDKHTALGDARWARDIYDAVTGPATVGAGE